MQLNLIIDDWSMDLDVTEDYIQAMSDSFINMDKGMDEDWQIGQKWVSNPSRNQRCQLAASKLLAALETNNEKLALMIGGDILSRMNGIKQVIIDNGSSPDRVGRFHLTTPSG
ncbi:MAG: hypothetical protein KZQ66_06585 [Candidatus Thiodiazotropha sp. (ex Lucinoma aequizonata)]|nr:hypothetical protein [Candidatus Thiodiazotropha sp. (ex Lucinoma aequizonata)]MCU7889558.1 hypothetical protein [Candidatus Thiodiazotropha sp. (ex Lucinoma aequizonata)]MCU7897011.1 hypothetical protein [Candidatus Thiodiazotropha sp. (ex Lucinoma aequizonata)]MCU7897576.1 hypothetical protein [Candidatus Thiodiazotropha sp. (ex Lucinoma aequizonata)]MCU7901691.1 hypothetical protein [Candidatus Thiodiazotropha sp. (ex Lucinoma aequizonata)]